MISDMLDDMYDIEGAPVHYAVAVAVDSAVYVPVDEAVGTEGGAAVCAAVDEEVGT